jgi:hypothetical protein
VPSSSDLDEYGNGPESPSRGTPTEQTSPDQGASGEPDAPGSGALDVGSGQEVGSDNGTEGSEALPSELVPPASESATSETEQSAAEGESTAETEPGGPEVDPTLPVVEPPSAAERCDGVLDPAQSPQTSCYRAVTLPATWDNGRIDCVGWGGSLVQVDSSEEDLFVGELVTTNQWLGASDTLIDNVYVWTNGSPISFGNWGASQPDRFPGADCVEKRETAGRQWFDQPCYNERAYVCEKGL